VQPKRSRAQAGPAALKVLEAAAELFARDGFTVGVDTISAASGANKATLYYAFDSKDGLSEAVLHGAHDRWRAQIAPGPATDPADAFRALTTPRALIAEQLFLRAAFQLDHRYPLARKAADEHVEAVQELFAWCAEASGHADPQRLARHLHLLINGAVAWLRSGVPARPAGRDARDAAEAVLGWARR
jgi:AcrR family transcriptional regulator